MIKKFETTGIYPLDRNKILSKLPDAAPVQNEVSCVNDISFKSIEGNRLGDPDKNVRRNKKRIPVKPGKNVSLLDLATPGTSKQPVASDSSDDTIIESNSEDSSSEDDMNNNTNQVNQNIDPKDITSGWWVIINFICGQSKRKQVKRFIDQVILTL